MSTNSVEEEEANKKLNSFRFWLLVISIGGIVATSLLALEFLGYANYCKNKEENDRVTSELAAQAEILIAKKAESTANETKIKELTAKTKRLSDEQDKVQTSVTKLAKQESALIESVKTLKAQNADLEKTRDAYLHEKAQWDAFAKKQEERASEIATWEAKVKSTKETIARLNEQVFGLNREIETKNASVSELGKQEAATSEAVNALKTQNADLEKTRDAYLEAKAQWDAFAETQQARASEVADWDAKLKNMQETVTRLNAQITALNQDLEAKHASISQLDSQISAKTGDKASMEAEVNALKNQLAELGKQRDDFVKAKAEWTKFQGEESMRRAQMRDAQNALAELTKKHDETTAQYEKQRLALLAEIEVLIKQKTDLKAQACEIDSLKRQVEELKDQLKKAQEETSTRQEA